MHCRHKWNILGRLVEAVKQVQDVLGDSVDEATIRQALLQYDCDVARATDKILSDQGGTGWVTHSFVFLNYFVIDFEKQKPALVAAIQAAAGETQKSHVSQFMANLMPSVLPSCLFYTFFPVAL